MKKTLIIVVTLLLIGCASKSTEELLIGTWISEENSDYTLLFTETSVYFQASLVDDKEYTWHVSGDTIYLRVMDDSIAFLIRKLDASHLDIAEENLFAEGFGETKTLIKEQ